MFFDRHDERNSMVKSIIALEEPGQVGLADIARRLNRFQGPGRFSWFGVMPCLTSNRSMAL